MSKNTLFKKRCHFWFWLISAEAPIFIVFPGLHCFGPKKILAKTDSVHENARFSALLTQIVGQSPEIIRKYVFHAGKCFEGGGG